MLFQSGLFLPCFIKCNDTMKGLFSGVGKFSFSYNYEYWFVVQFFRVIPVLTNINVITHDLIWHTQTKSVGIMK